MEERYKCEVCGFVPRYIIIDGLVLHHNATHAKRGGIRWGHIRPR